MKKVIGIIWKVLLIGILAYLVIGMLADSFTPPEIAVPAASASAAIYEHVLSIGSTGIK